MNVFFAFFIRRKEDSKKLKYFFPNFKFLFFHILPSQLLFSLPCARSASIMNSNTQPEEEECSICLDDLRKYGFNTFMRAPCCGKGMHIKCRDGVLVSSMSHKQKRHCVMCRTKYPDSAEETVEQLRTCTSFVVK